MKIKRKNIYKSLPKEVKEFIEYTGINKKIFSSYGFSYFVFERGIITEAVFNDGYFNDISWYMDYIQGFVIKVNGYYYNSKLRFHFRTLQEDNLPFSLEQSIIKYSDIIYINNSSPSKMMWANKEDLNKDVL